jgi:hypothetical protein
MNRQNLTVNGALVVVDILLLYLNVFIHLSEFFVQKTLAFLQNFVPIQDVVHLTELITVFISNFF